MTVDEANVGLYAGILTSSFMIGRALTAVHWGAVADTYGRKFVLLVSLITSVVGSIAFGLSTNFYAALAVRFTMGLFNGTMVVVRTMGRCPVVFYDRIRNANISSCWGSAE
jgi:MFS family permease